MNKNLKARLDVVLSHLEETMRPGASMVRELMQEYEGLERSLESTQRTVDALHDHLSAERDNAFLDASALAEMKAIVDDLQRKYDLLTGERFSDRSHTALRSRAEKAEADLVSIRASTCRIIEDRDKLLSKASDDAFDESFEFAEMKTRAEKAEAENVALVKENESWRSASVSAHDCENCQISQREEVAALKARIEKTHVCNDCPERSDLARIRKWVKKWRNGPPFVEAFADLDWILDEAEHAKLKEEGGE